MNLKSKIVLAAFAAAAAFHANASVITVSTAYSAAGAQTSAAAYKNVVENALKTQTTGYGTAVLASADNIDNSDLFGAYSNIAWKTTVDFNVASAATWSLRAGVDFGYGGALFLDGVAVSFKSNDMWTANSYTDTTQFFQYTSALAAGNHTLTLYGLENCCDASQQVQYKVGSGNYASFASTDGLNPKASTAVAEPATIASFGLGLGLLGLMRRRARRNRA
ncbi:PEP-CTERM sorting domain-containing protein [Massilia forsythiae]|uniref:PEP-CTERM sorting domain-containing protein n=1 Tax=Massilia forsythiae TaxID=2728020 RepID=A0A7Z2ZUD6_9BURK|nr:CCXG family PEP-CTERM protein [Massilia forsythiae]QJE02561.1 PEP-CTERM sorting domain-containing protein [Massilia forsythiae]